MSSKSAVAALAEKHEPLTRSRHAELVAYLIRYAPGAWRVLFRPSIYLYDDRDKVKGVILEDRAADLRIRFNSETDWNAANEIIHALRTIDATLSRMSVGVRIDGLDFYGEAL